ncbi:NADP-dependent oxidoreductase domain-containing protein [Corynascus similis CBS 632.67]
MTTPRLTAEMPAMMYGTAWKKERTADLVYKAIKAGFRGIDTAAMKKHYDEVGTGEGIRRAIREGICSRRDLFIQTKFTPLDNTSAYSPTDPIPAQVHTSIASSLANLFPRNSSDLSTTTAADDNDDEPYLDTLILHSPFPTTQQTLEAWSALTSYLPASRKSDGDSDLSQPPGHRRGRAGTILRLGISNVTLPVLHALSTAYAHDPAAAPQIVQNRFYYDAEPAWDVDVRAWCADNDAVTTDNHEPVRYQGFWTLTGNAGVWRRAGFVADVAQGAGVSLAGAWYVLLMEAAKVVVLNGTGNEAHMREDLEVLGRVERWRKGTAEGREVWRRSVEQFGQLVGGVVDQGGGDS